MRFYFKKYWKRINYDMQYVLQIFLQASLVFHEKSAKVFSSLPRRLDFSFWLYVNKNWFLQSYSGIYSGDRIIAFEDIYSIIHKAQYE